MKKTLLVITTGGCSQWLESAVGSLRDDLDVLVIDDASPEHLGIREFCNRNGVKFMPKIKPRGLTNSWNHAYRYMLKNKYHACIISNDDVRFPNRFSESLVNGLKKFDVTCPVSNRPSGNPGMFPKQWLFNYLSVPPKKSRKNRDEIQRLLSQKFSSNPYLPARYFNGFCFCIGRGIERFKFDDDHLFDPSRINTKNEVELGARIRRMGGKLAVCRTSYVWHFKAMTFKSLGLRDKNFLWTDSPLHKKKDEM